MHRFRVWLLLPALVLLLASTGQNFPAIESASPTLNHLLDSSDPSHRLAAMITASGLACLATREGEPLCIDLGDLALCLHPDTPPDQVEELLRRLPAFVESRDKTNFNSQARWSATALQPSTGVQGDPAIITWGFLPDGVMIPSGVGEPSSASVLHAVFDAHIPSATWKAKIRQALTEWETISGLSYVEVAYDDGAAFPMAVGIDGVRPDVRIGGHPIDGTYGILAYNSYPNGGDMVIDTYDWSLYDNAGADYRFLRNVVAHEHGHGIGLGHVIPSNGTKLMEPYASTAYDGVQDDDIRGAMRIYGDRLENNDEKSDAIDPGPLGSPVTYTDLSIDRGTNDTDWFLVAAPGGGELNVTATPVGSSYYVGPQGGSSSLINTMAVSDLEINIYDNTGTVLEHTENSRPVGITEELTGHTLAPGDHFVQIRRASGSGNGVQRYTLTLSLDAVSTAIAADDRIPGAGPLALSLQPNPFNPTTRIVLEGDPGEGHSVQIFDTAGREVRRFDVPSRSQAGFSLEWDGTDNAGRELPSGAYFVRASGREGETVRKAFLIR